MVRSGSSPPVSADHRLKLEADAPEPGSASWSPARGRAIPGHTVLALGILPAPCRQARQESASMRCSSPVSSRKVPMSVTPTACSAPQPAGPEPKVQLVRRTSNSPHRVFARSAAAHVFRGGVGRKSSLATRLVRCRSSQCHGSSVVGRRYAVP